MTAQIKQSQEKNTYACPRCGGIGFIRAFSNIEGGRCFQCGGAAKLGDKPGRTLQKFAISAVEAETGNRILIRHINAKSEAEAISKANDGISRGAGYVRGSAAVF